jgi:hypothetical protein
VLALALFAGCATWGGVPDDELPAQPIAIYYRTPEEARLRADAARRAAPAPAVSADGPTLVGSKAYLRADRDALDRLFTNVFGEERDTPDAHLGRLALLDPRTGEVALVAGALRGAVPQAWTPDHRALLFAQRTAPGGSDVQIFEWNAAVQTVRRVTVGPPVHSQACYGPEGRIVVTAVDLSSGAPASRIRISGPGGREPFTDLPEGPVDHSPTCAPDGSAVAFARTIAGKRSEIRVATAPFDAAPRLLGPGREPRFGSRGDWIVFASDSGGGQRVFRIRADGSGRTAVGDGGRDEAWPSASPDGKLVAYVASEASSRRVLVRRLDGSGDRILLASGEGEHGLVTGPTWNPESGDPHADSLAGDLVPVRRGSRRRPNRPAVAAPPALRGRVVADASHARRPLRSPDRGRRLRRSRPDARGRLPPCSTRAPPAGARCVDDPARCRSRTTRRR